MREHKCCWSGEDQHRCISCCECSKTVQDFGSTGVEYAVLRKQESNVAMSKDNLSIENIDALLTERIAEVVPEHEYCSMCDNVGSIEDEVCKNCNGKSSLSISLADVLRALSESNAGNGWTYACTAEGELMRIEWSYKEVEMNWNLSLSLLEQDYKTKVKLLELLKP